jgi:hypothetical protein
MSVVFVTLFHAILPRRGTVSSDRKLSRLSTTRHAKETESFSDMTISLHYMNRESWRRYHETLGLLVDFDQM